MKPIEFDDFSGGITDKDVPGAMNRAMACDNLLIDYDKKLLMRDGFDIYSSSAYQLDASVRVARIANFDGDTELVAFQNKKVFYQSTPLTGAWAELTGPGGGSSTQKAFNTDNASKLIEEAQWQHHLFAASSDGDPVIKMYRDSGNTMRLRTAGLPEFYSGSDSTASTYHITPTDGGLADAITLANDIRSKMISHFGANGASLGTPNNSSTGHHVADGAGVLAGQATSASATTAATTLGTLITLLNSLRGLYSAHVGDAQQEDPNPTPNASYNSTANWRSYHMKPAVNYTAYDPFIAYSTGTANTGNQPLYKYRHYLNFTLADETYTIPSSATIAQVLPYVNDLRDKWNWHTYASMTHYNAAYWQGNNYFTYLGSHATSYARVVAYTWANIVPNYGPFIQFVQDLYNEFAHHQANGMHLESDSVWAVPSGIDTTPDDLWEAINLLGWVAHGVTYHALESDTTFCANGLLGDEQRQASTTSGAATLTLGVGGFTADKYKYMRVMPYVGVSGAYLWSMYAANTRGTLHNVTASDTATPCVITTANNFSASQSTKQFVLSSRRYHLGYYDSQLFDPYDLASDWDDVDFTFQSASALQGLSDIAARVALYLKNHTVNRLTQNAVTGASIVKINGKKYNTWSNGLATAGSLGAAMVIHEPPGGANYTALGTSTTVQTYLQTNSALYVNNSISTQLAQDRFDTAPTAGSFNYKAVFKYDYTVGTKSFTDRSAPSEAINVIGFVNEDSGGITASGKYAASLSSIYAYSNAANENWYHTDTTNFRKEIYRTKANGTRYYKCDIDGTGGDITNATTTFSDYTTDTYLVDELELYTNGGAPENNKPPLATNIHVFGNVMYYVLGNKVYQSIPNDLDSVPSDFFEEFEENIIAVSSTRSVAVAFGTNRVYRLIGGFDDLGRGSLTYERIFDRTGAISAPSVVKADNGIFFAGKDGFYFTDGYQCMRVTDLEKTFRTYTDTAAKRNRIQGAYDNISKRVYWTVQTSAGSHPDKIWVLDLQFGIKPDATPIVTLSKTSGFNPTAIVFFNGQLYYGDGDGYTYVQTRGRNIDLVKDTGTAATSWAAETVRWDYKSCNLSFGTEAVRKYATRIGVQFDMQSTNVSAQIVSDADKGRITNNLPVIRSRKLVDWEGDSNGKLTWISSVYPAQAGNMVDEFRWLKGDGSLRANFRAIEIKTAYCVIVKSDDMGTITLANVSGNTWSATLTSLVATRKWPLYSVGYYLRINSVDYPITVRTSDSVVRFDATGLTTPTAGVPTSWEIWGYPKNERARLIGWNILTDLVDKQESHSSGPVTTGGGNA